MREAGIPDVGKVSIEAIDDPTPAMRAFVIRVSACSQRGIDPHIVRGSLSRRGEQPGALTTTSATTVSVVKSMARSAVSSRRATL